jgi:hypothetical protein
MGGCWAAHGIEGDAGGIGEMPGGVQRRTACAPRREIVESTIRGTEGDLGEWDRS